MKTSLLKTTEKLDFGLIYIF